MLKREVDVKRPLDIEIKKDGSSLTVPQRLVLEQRYYHLSQLYQANDSLDGKAMSLLQTTGLIFVLVGVLISHDLILKNILLVGISFIPFGLMVILLACGVLPKDTYTPGTQDWNKLYEQYIYKGNDDCFGQILDDCVETADRLLTRNKSKSETVVWAIILFGLQVIGLLIITLVADWWLGG